MSDDSQDVTLNVVPSLLPSCLPPLFSDVHEIPNSGHSEPNTNGIESHDSSSDVRCQGDRLDKEELPTTNVTSSSSADELGAVSFADKPECDTGANADRDQLPNDNNTDKETKEINKLGDDDTKECLVDRQIGNTDPPDNRDPFYEETGNEHDYDHKSLKLQCESSTSTDGTLRNSEESCESDAPVVYSVGKSEVNTNDIMGNKQGGKQGRGEDDREGRTKCCEIPKRKVKDRQSRSNRSSRHDDLAFDSTEVYPFDGRAISERELHEPVELEPFEIVETDDIKFVPGAGTSEVIKSVSEPKFSTIPEEPSHAIEFASTSSENQETELKVPYYIDKGNRLIEPGTSTAHSTFEFKQVKPKTKLVKITPDPYDHNYENVQLASDADGSVAGSNIDRKISNSSSKSSSTSSSKDLSRNNSKEAKQKPLRKGKSKTSNISDNPANVSSVSEGTNASAGDVRRKQPKGKREPAIRDSEIDRKIDSVLMLTQTMFSQTKVPDKSDDKVMKEDIGQALPRIKYENVGVVAKMESTGIQIVHQEVPLKASKEGCEKMTQCAGGNHCEIQDEPCDTSDINKLNTYAQLPSDIIEISESGTLIIKSLADLPSEKPGRGNEVLDYSKTNDDSSDQDSDQTDRKTSYEAIEDETEKKHKQNTYESVGECQNEMNRNVPLQSNEKLSVDGAREIAKSPHELEDVPPPSPTAMDVLAEEEEDEEEYDNDDDDFDDDKRQSAEIVEFTENVCKRLSQLLILEGQRQEEEEEAEEEVEGNENNDTETRSDRRRFADHIYETIDGSTKGCDRNEDTLELQTEVNKETDNESLNNSLKLSTRSESTGTLKRTSGDSETYQRLETKESASSESSDDMPSYFEPSQHSLPHTDSDSYQANQCLMEMTGDKISKNVKSDKTNFEGGSYDNVTLESESNVISEPLKTFELDLMDATSSVNRTEDLLEATPTAEAQPKLTPLTELANVEVETPLQYDTSGRLSVTCTESDLDISEHRDDLSTDSMLADDEAEETMEILFTKTYTEPVEGAEVFLSCTVVNSAYKDEQKKSETWLSDEALEYFEANASEVMSTAFLKAKKEMKDIQICLQSLRQQMEHFHSDCDDISLPEIPVDSLSPDYFGIPHRKAITD